MDDYSPETRADQYYFAAYQQLSNLKINEVHCKIPYIFNIFHFQRCTEV